MKNVCVLALILGVAIAPLAHAQADSAKDEAQQQKGRNATTTTAYSFTTSTQEGSVLFSGLGMGMFVAASGDVASTEWGLSRAGVYEANPLMRNRAVRIGTHVMAPMAMWWASEQLYNKGQRKLAWAVRIGVAAAYGYASLRNVRAVSGLK